MASKRSKKAPPLGDEQVVASLAAIEQERLCGVAVSKKRVRVTALAAAAVALAAKERPLTAKEEEQLKTRLQYRLYQRNHRARRERKVDELAREIEQLRDEIRTLEDERAAKRRSCARHAVEEFLTEFRSVGGRGSGEGDVGAVVEQEDRFRRYAIHGNVETNWIGRQWRSLCEGFSCWNVAVEGGIDVIDLPEHSSFVVACPLVLHIRASVQEWEAEFGFLEETELGRVVSNLVKTDLVSIPGYGFFLVAAKGIVQSVSMDFDLVTTLRSALQLPVRVVASVVSGSRRLRFLGTSGGEESGDIEQAAWDIDVDSERDSVGSNPRHSLDFLLDGMDEHGDLIAQV